MTVRAPRLRWRGLAMLALLGALAACGAAPGRPGAPDEEVPEGEGPAEPGASREEIPAPPEAPLAMPTPPAASVRDLASGARAVIVERRDSPRVALRLVVSAGTSADGERAGVAMVTAHAVAMTVAERAAALGAEVRVDVVADAAVFGLAVHPADRDAAIALLADVVRSARPGAPDVQRARSRAAAAARQAAAEDDDHGASYVIVRDLFDLPTARHPYGTTSPTAEEIAEVGPADVRALLATRYVPAGASLIVAGDVVATAVGDAADRALGRGPARLAPGLGLTEPFARERDRVTVVDRVGADGAHVFIGLAAPPAGSEVALIATEVALQVAAARLGGGAAARTLRFREGPQIARLDVRTTPGRAQADVRRALEGLDRLAEAAPTEGEVAAALRVLVGSMARDLASPDGIADALADAAARGLPEDAVARRLRVLGDISSPIVSVAARGLAEAPAHVVVIGAGQRVGPQLAELAEVKVVDPMAGYGRVRSLPQVPR